MVCRSMSCRAVSDSQDLTFLSISTKALSQFLFNFNIEKSIEFLLNFSIVFFFSKNVFRKYFFSFRYCRSSYQAKRRNVLVIFLLTCSEDGDGQLSGRHSAKPGSKLDGRFLIKSSGREYSSQTDICKKIKWGWKVSLN